MRDREIFELAWNKLSFALEDFNSNEMVLLFVQYFANIYNNENFPNNILLEFDVSCRRWN